MSTQTTDTELKELLEKFSRNSIVLDISEKVPITKGWTRFGGQPDVPPDWDEGTKNGPDRSALLGHNFVYQETKPHGFYSSYFHQRISS